MPQHIAIAAFILSACFSFVFTFFLFFLKQLSGYRNVNTQNATRSLSHTRCSQNNQKETATTLGLTAKLGSLTYICILLSHFCGLSSFFFLSCTHAVVNESSPSRCPLHGQHLWRGLSSLKRRWIGYSCCESLSFSLSLIIWHTHTHKIIKSSFKYFGKFDLFHTAFYSSCSFYCCSMLVFCSWASSLLFALLIFNIIKTPNVCTHAYTCTVISTCTHTHKGIFDSVAIYA